MVQKILVRTGVAILVGGLALSWATQGSSAPTPVTSLTKAADLRVTVNNLLAEHAGLAASASGAALAGRPAQFNAAASALDANSDDIINVIASVYGDDAGRAFGQLWKKHIGFVIDYTNGLAAKDKARQEKAVTDLLAYSRDFGAFINSATKTLPTDAVADLVKLHILTLKAVIDDQASEYPGREFADLRKAYAHMGMIAEPLSGAIARQFPGRYPGAIDSPAAGLRVALNTLLAEHVYLAARATAAALGGRQIEFRAAAAALDGNSNDITAAVASIYGEGAGAAFGPLWKKHIGFVVDYAAGLGAHNRAKQDKAVSDLLGYTREFGAFLSSATKSLPTETVADLVKMHILTLKDVIDAQAAGDQAKAYGGLRKAMSHMRMVADPLAEAIVMQFPDRFSR